MVPFGVSPAFVVSLFGEKFTPAEFCKGLKTAQKMGFQAYQPEIFLPETLDAWVNGGAQEVAQCGKALGLAPSQFVAHFLLHEFGSPERLSPQAGLDELKKVVAMVSYFTGCDVLTIPVAPFIVTKDSWGTLNGTVFETLQSLLMEKLAIYDTIVAEAGLKLALEVMPYSIVGGIGGFLKISQEIGSATLGFNLDTGHVRACGESLATVPWKLQGRIYGLHLKELVHTPRLMNGAGHDEDDHDRFFQALYQSGYRGSWDLEINCRAEEVEHRYHVARARLKSLATPEFLEVRVDTESEARRILGIVDS
ncbi:sugar phosphate isomerase/epimerase family protein [Planctomycetota bacterium]